MALFILIGMIIYTTLYRRRGKPEDKVFFALILTDIVMSVGDGLYYFLMGLGIDNSVTAAVCGFVSLAALDVFMLMYFVMASPTPMAQAEWNHHILAAI